MTPKRVIGRSPLERTEGLAVLIEQLIEQTAAGRISESLENLVHTLTIGDYWVTCQGPSLSRAMRPGLGELPRRDERPFSRPLHPIRALAPSGSAIRAEREAVPCESGVAFAQGDGWCRPKLEPWLSWQKTKVPDWAGPGVLIEFSLPAKLPHALRGSLDVFHLEEKGRRPLIATVQATLDVSSLDLEAALLARGSNLHFPSEQLTIELPSRSRLLEPQAQELKMPLFIDTSDLHLVLCGYRKHGNFAPQVSP